ncbi:MAG: thiosulfate/3-mercaptopyruvate sulfurtransferase [Acidimicrobiales bacterium]|jgi:thiosulfate/3-mercaptopyruvate sulfurtransferase
MIPPIVDAEWLASPAATDIVLCDIRYYLDGRDGPSAFEAGHIPGARYVDMDTVLASPAAPIVGRHPMPTPETFAKGMAAVGVSNDAVVVAYDDLGGMVAGRLVWMLRIIGQPAALLDGGIKAWGGPVETGAVTTAGVPRLAVEWPSEAMADANEVAAHISAGGIVVDSRAAERYRGDTEPVDPRAGHVPGAINLPFSDNLTGEGRYRDTAELTERFETAGVNGDSIVYCGSGVSACNNLLAIEAAGLGRPRLYVGSWSGWSSDSERPAATS